MNRTEIEIKLNRDRAWLLETFAALAAEDLTRGLTTSRHNSEARWSAKDHMSHLIGTEAAFNAIIRRHLEGDANPIAIAVHEDGTRRSQDEIMEVVHALNEAWVEEHRGQSFSEVIALGQKVRSQTLALLASLTDAQLEEKVPGAPWADGTIGGILVVNGEHARRHYGWVKDALAKDA